MEDVKKRWRTLRDNYTRLFKQLSHHGTQRINEEQRSAATGVNGLILKHCDFLDAGIIRKMNKKSVKIKQEAISDYLSQDSLHSYSPLSTEPMDTEPVMLPKSQIKKEPNFAAMSQEPALEEECATAIPTVDIISEKIDDIMDHEKNGFVDDILECISNPDDSQVERLKEIAQNSTVLTLSSNLIGACSKKRQNINDNFSTFEAKENREYTPESIIIVDTLVGLDSKSRAKKLKNILLIGKKYNNNI